MIAHHYRGGRELHQSCTMGALVDGVYDSDVTIADILRHSDFGPGTFNHRDGQNVTLGGNHDLVSTNVSARILD
jgi:acetolactate decarboxylase